jgi:hypothetical protein
MSPVDSGSDNPHWLPPPLTRTGADWRIRFLSEKVVCGTAQRDSIFLRISRAGVFQQTRLISAVVAKSAYTVSKVLKPMKHEPMKRIGLNYRKKLSPRTNIVLTVIYAIVAGFFLGAALFEYLHGRGVMSWITPLVMAFVTGLTTLKGTLVALGNCPRSTKTPENEAALHNARA